MAPSTGAGWYCRRTGDEGNLIHPRAQDKVACGAFLHPLNDAAPPNCDIGLRPLVTQIHSNLPLLPPRSPPLKLSVMKAKGLVVP